MFDLGLYFAQAYLSKFLSNYFVLFLLQEASACDGDIQQLKDHQGELSQQLETKQTNVQHLQGSSDTLDGDIDRLVETKQKVKLANIFNSFTATGDNNRLLQTA